MHKLRFISLVVATYFGVGAFIVAAPFSNAQSVRQRATLAPPDNSTLIDLRSAPAGRVLGQGRSGDSGEIIDEHQGNDGYTWYFIRFPTMTRGAWVRADAVALGSSARTDSNQVIPAQSGSPSRSSTPPPAVQPIPSQPISGQPPSGTPQYATTGSISNAPTPQPPTRQRLGFRRPATINAPVVPGQPPRTATVTTNAPSQESIDYFLEVALGSEWGSSSNTIRRWTQDVRIQVMGSPTQADLSTLDTVVAELNQLTNGQVNLQIVQDNSNVQLYLVPESEFSRYEPNYVPRNLGFFWARWNNSGIYSSRILVSSTGISQSERSHLIREELTQSMGLMRDSYRYDDSIFQQRWTQTNQYSAIDRAVIQLLYRPDIRPGMTREQVLAQLRR